MIEKRRANTEMCLHTLIVKEVLTSRTFDTPTLPTIRNFENLPKCPFREGNLDFHTLKGV